MISRVLAIGALGVAVVVLAVLLMSSGSSYTLKLDFQDAGGLVAGNQVMIGPAIIGTVKGTRLTDDGQAQIEIALDSKYAPLHLGTVAHIYENSLSGSANRYAKYLRSDAVRAERERNSDSATTGLPGTCCSG